MAASFGDVGAPRQLPAALQSSHVDGTLADLIAHSRAGDATTAILLAHELGRHLAPATLSASLAAALLADEAGDLALADRIARGELTVGWAANGGGVAVGGSEVDQFLMPAANAPALLEFTDIDWHAEPLDVGAPTGVAGESRAARTFAPQSADLAFLLVAAEASGIAMAAVELSAAYARERSQFGRPIGYYQAIKHRCADMLIRTDSAWSLTRLATAQRQHDPESKLFHARAAALLATDAAVDNAADDIQNHGGVGTLGDNPAHRFLRRAHVLQALVRPGSPRELLDIATFLTAKDTV